MWIAGGRGIPISLAYGYQMSGFDQERTRWFLRNILPHEPELRAWLSRSTVVGLEPDDVIQQSYAIFAEMERVDTISYPRAYLFQIARSLITRHIRRARIVPLHAIDERFDCPDDSPSPEQYAVDRDELRERPTRSRRCPIKCARPSSCAGSTVCPSAKSLPK